VKDNQLNVFDKNGRIYIEWDVNKRSNPDDEWFDDEDIFEVKLNKENAQIMIQDFIHDWHCG
jgi:hypothetical protein